MHFYRCAAFLLFSFCFNHNFCFSLHPIYLQFLLGIAPELDQLPFQHPLVLQYIFLSFILCTMLTYFPQIELSLHS